MAGKTSYELHHHFPRVAEESGFTFNIHRPRGHIDWNKFRLIDIDGLIRERKFTLIEQHLNDILQCALESEFDVRILDEGVVKMFRLAQLAIEYQQFCRHYLDRSVFVLREEITAVAQELDITKKELREKEDEIRKLKRKTKHTYRTPLPYGNDNIATMILKTLATKGDMFPSTSNSDALQYNKCSYCDKVFLNQLYLQSHLSRRHPNVIEIPQKDVPDNGQKKSEQENTRLNDEVMELKSKLKEMETMIAKASNQVVTETTHTENNTENNMKDVVVSTNNEDYLLDKIEEWKREEHEKYNKEITLLRTQIIETINSIKEKDIPKSPENNPNVNLIEQLHATIKQQGAEIVVLKNELANSKQKSQNADTERKAEVDTQMLLWNKRTEAQAKQYESLLQKLNEVAQEARESRAIADSERERATQLQALLHQNLNNQVILDNDRHNHQLKENSKATNTADIPTSTKTKLKKSLRKTNPVADRNTLENLHRKAQELLNIRSTDSSSDMSSTSVENQPNPITTEKSKLSVKKQLPPNGYNIVKENQRGKSNPNPAFNSNSNHKRETLSEPKVKKNKTKTRQNGTTKVGNGVLVVPQGSPLKLVRARLTEEVNSRLVSAGIDPLKSSMPQQVFKKQRMHLQQLHELKSKKNPEYQKTRNSILAFLDSTISNSKKIQVFDNQDYTSPTKLTKPFSFTNVISNVKSKALSFVKSNDMAIKSKRKTFNAEVARKAMSLLKTPPDSMNTSPAIQRKIIDPKSNSPRDAKTNLLNAKSKLNSDSNIMEKMRQTVKGQEMEVLEDSEEDSYVSDHKYYNSQNTQQSTKSIENLIKSPARRPSSATADYNNSIRKYVIESEPYIVRTQSENNISENKKDTNFKQIMRAQTIDNSSDEVESVDIPMKKTISVENIREAPKHTKGVLKNASSTSSLNKKKVLFDMDAIQMKSVSASPSQSTTEKSDVNEKFELGLLNLDGEEWDISSIENEPLKNDTKIQVNTRTSPKIAELKHTIESQLARRSDTPTALVGAVNLMPTPMARTSSIAGSNTSLGSSILDESDGMPPVVNNKAFVRPKRVTAKDDSEIDISEYSLDGVVNKKGNDSF